MRRLLRRLTMFPLLCLGMLLIFPMVWMMTGSPGKALCKDMLLTLWNGQ